MKANATLVVRESQPHYFVLNYEANAIIAEGFTTRAVAETYAKTLRTQQERWQQTAFSPRLNLPT